MAYQIIKELGRGGFGQVSEVSNANGQRFALKVFSPNDELKVFIGKGLLDENDLKKRFYKEVKYQSKINNKNVVKIVDSDLQAPSPWYAMELASGTLQDDLKADRTLGANLRPALFDILNGLEAIHDLGITHRDLKPVNILKFTEPDGKVRYAISDFGLITALTSDTTTITRTGHGGGTPIYAAPELITNFKFATATADIYSFGAILHDIFAGTNRTPYLELTVPGPCRSIVEKCTKKNPIRRYPDVAALRADLFEALNSPALNFSSNEEAEIIEILKQKDTPSDEEWDRYFQLLEDAKQGQPTKYNLFRAVRSEHIKSLATAAPDLLNALGMQFSEYVRTSSHDFDYCDVLADKLEQFFNAGAVALKAHVLVSLLIMGVDHNRWFVERKLLKLATPTLDDKVAARIALDVDAEGLNMSWYIARWENSISTSRTQLHPQIAALAPPQTA